MNSDSPAGRALPKRVWWPLGLLLAARLALGLAYSLVVPPWESYDEPGHFQYARYIARYHRLLQTGDPEAEVIWSKFQPPLYYLLAAPALLGYDLGETFQHPIANPYLANGNAGLNYTATSAHPTGQEAQTILALRMGRAVGAVICTLSVVFIFLTARRLWPAEPLLIWAATLLYAFWPQFLFNGSMMTNDLLMASLAAPVLYMTVRLLQDGLRRRWLAAVGGLLAAAALTKLNGLAFAPPALLAILLSFTGQQKRRALLGLAALVLLTLGAVWVLSMFEFVTGQVFQIETLRRFIRNLVQSRSATPVIGHLTTTDAITYGFWTFFASYGWGNLETLRPLYWLWAIGAGLAAVGLIRLAVQPGAAFPPSTNARRLSPVVIIAVAQILSLIGFSVALAIAQQDPYLVVGRYWLPGLPAVIVALLMGWRALTPPRHVRLVLQTACVAVLTTSWVAPFAVIAPAYARPPAPTRIDARVNAIFGDAIELIGYERPASVLPGSPWTVTLCWQARAPILVNYPMRLEIVGVDGQGYGRLETWPGGGNYPTALWEVHAPFCDHYTLGTDPALPAPAQARLMVQVIEKPGGPALAVQTGGGTRDTHEVYIPIKAWRATASAEALESTRYTFGNQIALTGYALLPQSNGQPGVRLILRWEALTDVNRDYTVFVHLRDTPETPFAQSDGPPRNGAYPTLLWNKGEVIIDERVLTFPADRPAPTLALYVGLLDVNDGNRPAVLDAQGRPVENGEVILRQGLTFAP